MIKLVLGLAAILAVVAGYFQWRLRYDQRQLVDYLSDHHKTMTPQQIRASRQFMMTSDYWRRPQLVRGHRLARIGKIIAVASAILVGLELLGLFDGALNAQLWFSESLGGVVIGLALNSYGHWDFNRKLATLTAPTDDLPITLATTPKVLGEAAAKHHASMRLAWLAVVVLGLFASSVNWWPVEGLRYQAGRLAVTALVHQIKQTKLQPVTGDERLLDDPKAVQKQATGSTAGLTAQQTAGLLSLYYEAASNQDLWRMRNGVTARYTYYVVKQKSAKVYVVKRQTDTDETSFIYSARVASTGVVTLSQSSDPTGERTDLQDRIPKQELIPNTTVKLGQLVTAYQHQRAFRLMVKALHPGGELTTK